MINPGKQKEDLRYKIWHPPSHFMLGPNWLMEDIGYGPCDIYLVGGGSPEDLGFDKNLFKKSKVSLAAGTGLAKPCGTAPTLVPRPVIVCHVIRTVPDGIEFRSVTLTAVKPKNIPCVDDGHAVIYRGPFSSVRDDEGHEFPRGERMAVCDRSYRLLTEGPYKDDFIGLTPHESVESKPWSLPAGTRRPVSESKGAEHEASCCSDGGCC